MEKIKVFLKILQFWFIYRLCYTINGFVDPENQVLDTKNMSLSGMKVEILPKIEILNSANTKIPQGCQAGNRLFLIQDSPEMKNPQKYFLITHLSTKWPFDNWTIWANPKKGVAKYCVMKMKLLKCPYWAVVEGLNTLWMFCHACVVKWFSW